MELDASIVAGTVSVITETQEDADELLLALKQDSFETPSERIYVQVAEHAFLPMDEADIYGGQVLKDVDGNPTCTTGFTVHSVPSGSPEGTTTAGHCPNHLRHGGIDLVFQAQRNSGEYDFQWMTTPGLNDRPWVKDTDGTREINSKLQRSEQSIGSWICKYGITTQKTCGELISKIYQPPQDCTSTTDPTPTYMRVSRDDGQDLSSFGDSGGPWYTGHVALGFHKGSVCGAVNDAYYMAQNYTSVLDVTVSLAN